MAKGDGKTLEKLYIELGLDLSALQSDLLAADRTVTENLGRLNRERNTIKLRVAADTAGLDRIKDATQIFEIQERGLNQQLTLSRDKLAILEAAYRQVANNQNSSALAVQRAEQAWQKERLEVAKLEQALKSLSAQKISVDTTRITTQLQDNISKLNAKIQHVRIQADIDTSKLTAAGSVFDAQKTRIAAVTRELELQRQKLAELQNLMKQSAQQNGNNTATLNIKTNVLQQIQEIQRLEIKLKELQSKNINLQIRADSIRQAEQTISENIARINAKIEHIRVKTDIDVSKLGTAATEFDKAKAHVQGLNRELTLQNQKLLEMRRALSASISTNGLNNVKTINLQTEIQKQIQAIDQLKAKINELNKIQPPKNNSLLSGYLNIKGDITGKLNSMTSAFANLKGATSSADSAITSVLGVIGEIPHPVGRAVAALVGLPLIFKGIENSILDMTRAAAASGDAVYVMSRGMQMSIKDAGKFSTNAKVAGTDVKSLEMAIKQVQRTIVKGGDDSRAAEWLKRYGESARDANGNLKNLNEMTFALSRALHKAQEEGKGAEFIFSVFRSVSADDITAIEDWIAVNEQAATIVKNGLANPKLAHEVKGNLYKLAIQEGQLKASFESALLPVANEIIPRIIDRMGKMTQVIADNKDVIKELGSDLASIWGGIENVADKIGSGVGKIGGVLKDVYMARAKAENKLVERYKDDASIKTAEDLLKKELSRSYTPTERAAIESTPYLYQQELRKYEPISKAIHDAREKIQEEKKSLASTIAEGIAGNILKPFVDSLNQDITPDLQKYRDEVDAILYKLNHTDYENKIYDVEKRYEAALRDGDKTLMEQAELQKLRQAQLAQIQKEQLEKTQQYYKEAADTEYRLTHTAFEKQLRDIEQWKEAQMQKASTAEEVAGIIKNSAAKEAEAFEAAMDRIRGKLQSLDDKIFAQEHSQYEQDLRRIEQERRRYYDEFQKEGALTSDVQSRIERWFSGAVNDLNKKAAKGGDYTKPPEGTPQRGGNGIMVIGADQIVDDGKINQAIGVLVDDSREFAQQLQGLSEDGRNLAIANRQLAESQRALAQASQQATSGFQLIEGDKFVNQPATSQSPQPQSSYQVIGGDQVVAEVQQFGDAVQQAQNPLQDFRDSTASAKAALAEAANSFSPDYFKNLAEDTKALSEMQYRLNESTEKLITAQDKLAAALDSLPTEDATRRTGQNQQPTNGVMKLTHTTQDLQDAQNGLIRTTRQTDDRLKNLVSDIPRQQAVTQKNSGIQFGIDYDTFKDVLLTGVGLAGGAAATGVGTAAIPAIAIGTLATAITTAIAKGSYDETKAASAQQLPVEADLSQLIAPITAISDNVQSILQALPAKEQSTLADMVKPEMFAPLSNLDTPLSAVIQQIQDAQPLQTDRLQELFGTLPNIEENVKSVLLELQGREESKVDYLTPLSSIDTNVQNVLQSLQARGEVPTTLQQSPDQSVIDYLTPLTNIDSKLQGVLTAMQSRETTISFETVVTPLNNIHTVVGNILTALSNRQPPQINVSPNISIDLGGAYVFDNAMKRELTDDCAQRIVDNITSAVQQATSRSNYAFGA